MRSIGILTVAIITPLMLVFNLAVAQEPDTTGTVKACGQADKYLSDYNFSEALQQYKTCAEEDSANASVLAKMALCYTKLGQFADAKRVYNQVITIDPNNLSALNQLAGIAAKESDYESAIGLYKQLIEIDSTNSYYFKQFGEMELKNGNVPNAILGFQLALQLNPNDVESITRLIQVYQEIELVTEADSLIEVGMAIDTSNKKLLLLRIKSAYGKKNYQKVVTDAKRLLEMTANPSSYLLKAIGVSQFHLGEYQKAVDALQRSVKMDGGTEVVHYYLGMAYRDLGDNTNSVLHFEKAISSGTSSHLATYYTNLAVSLEEQGNYKQSIQAYQKAYSISNDKTLLYHLARNYDRYYADKQTALRYYELYLTSQDTVNANFNDFSEHRISELKRAVHFDIDSLQ